MTLYTAIGRYELKTNADGEKIPHVIVGGKEHELDIWEMIIWSSLIWNIYTFSEVSKEFYRKEREAHVLGECDCETYLDRMERDGLISCGHGVMAEDALRDLLNKLYAIPVSSNALTKVAAFLHLTFVKRVPFEVTKHIFSRQDMSAQDKRLLNELKRTHLTVGGHMGCSEILSMSGTEILMGISTLYLNKHIMLDIQ